MIKILSNKKKVATNLNKFERICSLVGIQRRISQGLKVLQYYTTKNWTFKNEKFLHMKANMSPKDRDTFYFSVEDVCISPKPSVYSLNV